MNVNPFDIKQALLENTRSTSYWFIFRLRCFWRALGLILQPNGRRAEHWPPRPTTISPWRRLRRCR